MSVGSSSQIPFFLTLNFVYCLRISRPDLELAPVPFNKFFIQLSYFFSGHNFFLSSIVSFGNLKIEKNVGGLNKDVSSIIAMSWLE